MNAMGSVHARARESLIKHLPPSDSGLFLASLFFTSRTVPQARLRFPFQPGFQPGFTM